jgi:hypothetical protein
MLAANSCFIRLLFQAVPMVLSFRCGGETNNQADGKQPVGHLVNGPMESETEATASKLILSISIISVCPFQSYLVEQKE